MMKNKDKRKEIVRRMSRVYVNNNPILYVIESNDDDFNNQPVNQFVRDTDFSQSPPKSSKQSEMPTVRSKLSLSLPHGINSLHNTYNGNNYQGNL